jgi:hypothetical protein
MLARWTEVVSGSTPDRDSGMSMMLTCSCSATSLSPVRNSTANGSENAYDSRSVSSTPTAFARPTRRVRAAASGPA